MAGGRQHQVCVCGRKQMPSPRRYRDRARNAIDCAGVAQARSEISANRLQGHGAGQMTVDDIVSAARAQTRLGHWLKQHPELLERPIEKPLFVFGLSRQARRARDIRHPLRGADARSDRPDQDALQALRRAPLRGCRKRHGGLPGAKPEGQAWQARVLTGGIRTDQGVRAPPVQGLRRAIRHTGEDLAGSIA